MQFLYCFAMSLVFGVIFICIGAYLAASFTSEAIKETKEEQD